jgi:hypothetical protein
LLLCYLEALNWDPLVATVPGLSSIVVVSYTWRVLLPGNPAALVSLTDVVYSWGHKIGGGGGSQRPHELSTMHGVARSAKESVPSPSLHLNP